jgi:heat shock protein HslJ
VALLIVAVVARDDIGSSGGGIEGVDWILDEASLGMLGGGAPVEGAVVSLRLEDGVASGSAGCNSYTGSYTVDGTAIAFAGFAQTQMACDEPLMALDQAYLGALGSVDAFQTSGDALVLTGSGLALSYGQPPQAALTGTTWTLDSIASGSAVSTASVPADIVFLDDGTVSGSTGCNRFNGTYQADAVALTFSPLVTTKMACDDAANAQELAVLTGLAATTAYAIDGSTLFLVDAAGSLVLGYRA